MHFTFHRFVDFRTSVNPRLLCHGESCDYTLSSFKQRNKNEIEKSISENHENPFALIFKPNFIWQSKHNWSFRTSKFTFEVSGLKFFHKHTKIQFLEKIKWNSKIYLLEIIKTPLLYHLKQIWWQSIHKRSFSTSKFSKISGLKFL